MGDFENQRWTVAPSLDVIHKWILIKGRAVFDNEQRDVDVLLNTHGGHWVTYFDNHLRNDGGFTQLDLAWFAIRELIRADILMQAKCSTFLWNANYQNLGVILCYTMPFTDKDSVRRIAEWIRGSTHYRYSMKYRINEEKCWTPAVQDLDLYMHTVDNELYERNLDAPHPYDWTLVLRNSREM